MKIELSEFRLTPLGSVYGGRYMFVCAYEYLDLNTTNPNRNVKPTPVYIETNGDLRVVSKTGQITKKVIDRYGNTRYGGLIHLFDNLPECEQFYCLLRVAIDAKFKQRLITLSNEEETRTMELNEILKKYNYTQ